MDANSMDYTLENTDEAIQELLPYLTSPGIDYIEDTSIEMSGLAGLTTEGFSSTGVSEYDIFSDDTIIWSGVTGTGVDDIVAGSRGWLGGVGDVQMYDSLTTPTLITSTMVEPVRALSPEDATMCEPADGANQWGSLSLDTSSERLLDGVVGSTDLFESFALDASTERLLDGVVGSIDLWESFALDASTERLLDAAPTFKYSQLLNVT